MKKNVNTIVTGSSLISALAYFNILPFFIIIRGGNAGNACMCCWA